MAALVWQTRIQCHDTHTHLLHCNPLVCIIWISIIFVLPWQEELNFWERNISRENTHFSLSHTHTHTPHCRQQYEKLHCANQGIDTSLIKTNVNHTHFSSLQPCKNPLHTVPLQPSSSSCIQLIHDTYRGCFLWFFTLCAHVWWKYAMRQ